MDKMKKINGFAILMLGAAFFIYIGKDTITSAFNLRSEGYDFLGLQSLLLIFMSFSILVFQYLRGAFLADKFKPSSLGIKSSSIESSSDYFRLRDRVEGLDDRINKLISSIEKSNSAKSSIELSQEEKTELINSIKESVDKNVTTELLTSIDNQYSIGALNKNNLKQLLELYFNTEKRIRELLYELDRKAKLNLFVGSITTVGAILGLAYIVFTTEQNFTDLSSSLNHYVPKISFIILIEIFSFFFLKLYKQNLEDIKYHNNELTNLDSKIIALKASIFIDEKDSIKKVITALGNTERNFILKKGETTVELEKARDNRASFSDAVSSITKLLSKTKVETNKE